MNLETALSHMRDVVARWYVGQARAADIVHTACDLLVAGLDGPSLCMLAAVSVRHADEEVPELLEAALRDVGLAFFEKGTQAAQETGLQAMAARVLSGAMTPRELAVWAHATFGHGTLERAERLVQLDDFYDTVDYMEATVEDLDAEVLRAARGILNPSAQQ
ncbi:hypothetical protein [Amycolatopsis keratiniphila]|uniref:hypothetical protein n=1 Tax=Amycolatopsis keratiniphila TaxID=129921 RepID=UPI0009DCCCE4|nr:hypothetical protein [Amycolatopsis keratiniphila]